MFHTTSPSIAQAAASLAIAGMFLSACASPPTKAMDDAESALLAAQTKRECAEEKFRAAEQLLEEARQLVAQKEYDAAERKAKAARKLAEEANAYADANWEECQRRRQVANEARTPAIAPKPTDNTSTYDPSADEKPWTLGTVYFDYNSFDLSDDSRRTLEDNVRWLKQNTNTQVLLEGHTDERGTPEYNLALGERRARSVQQYLVQLGVSGERVLLISYGEEKPASVGQGESDFSLNRRVEFVPQR